MNTLTEAQLKKGLEVIIVGAVWPRTPWRQETAGQAEHHNSLQLDERPKAKVVAWSQSRFGGVFVDVKIGKEIETHALSDLVAA